MKEFLKIKAEIKEIENLFGTTGGCSGQFSPRGIWDSNESGYMLCDLILGKWHILNEHCP